MDHMSAASVHLTKHVVSKSECHSAVSDSVTPRAIALQAPLSMEFSRHESWSGLPFPSPRDLPDPGIGHGSPALQAYSAPSEPPGKPKCVGTSAQIRVFKLGGFPSVSRKPLK